MGWWTGAGSGLRETEEGLGEEGAIWSMLSLSDMLRVRALLIFFHSFKFPFST